MLQAIPCTTTPASSTALPSQSSDIEKTVIRLRQEGLSIAAIKQATGLSERRVKELVKGVPVVLKTPFSKSVAQAYELAIRPQGIKDYVLREILYKEYGSTWDEQKGRYQAEYTSDTIRQVKEKVRERACSEGQSAIFVMDWVCDHSPTESRAFLEQAAIDLMSRVEECLGEFLEKFAAHTLEDSEAADLAHCKQAYAARRHIWKLVSGLGVEPVPTLLERTAVVTSMLDGVSDLPAPAIPRRKPAPIPEPLHSNAFLDYVESQGWC